MLLIVHNRVIHSYFLVWRKSNASTILSLNIPQHVLFLRFDSRRKVVWQNMRFQVTFLTAFVAYWWRLNSLAMRVIFKESFYFFSEAPFLNWPETNFTNRRVFRRWQSTIFITWLAGRKCVFVNMASTLSLLTFSILV